MIDLLRRLAQRWQSQRSAQHHENPANNQLLLIGQPHPTEEEHRSAEQAYWRSQVEAQQKINWVGWVTLCFSGLAAIATGLAWLASKEQACQARRQANIAEAALASSDRPWLSVEYVSHGSLAFYPGGFAQIPLVFNVENGGRSVATSVRSEADAVPAGDSDVEFNLPDKQRATCNQGDAGPAKAGAIIFPGKSVQFPVFVVISKQRIDEATKKQSVIRSFATTVCVSYAYGNAKGHTALSLTITGKPENAGFNKNTGGLAPELIEVMTNVMVPAQAD